MAESAIRRRHRYGEQYILLKRWPMRPKKSLAPFQLYFILYFFFHLLPIHSILLYVVLRLFSFSNIVHNEKRLKFMHINFSGFIFLSSCSLLRLARPRHLRFHIFFLLLFSFFACAAFIRSIASCCSSQFREECFVAVLSRSLCSPVDRRRSDENRVENQMNDKKIIYECIYICIPCEHVTRRKA